MNPARVLFLGAIDEAVMEAVNEMRQHGQICHLQASIANQEDFLNGSYSLVVINLAGLSSSAVAALNTQRLRSSRAPFVLIRDAQFSNTDVQSLTGIASVCLLAPVRYRYIIAAANEALRATSDHFAPLSLRTDWQPTSERFRKLLDSTSDAILSVDAHGRILLANPAAERLFGYARDEMIGKGMEMLVPECLRSQHRSYRKKYTANPHHRPMGSGLQVRGRRKDGSEFPADVALGFAHTAAGLEVTAIIRDVTEREKMIATIREAERRYLSLYESNPTTYFTVSAEGRILSINSFGAAQLGYDVGELLNTSASDLLHGESDRTTFTQQIAACIAVPRKVLGCELQMLRKDGRAIWVRCTCRGCDDDHGSPVVYVVCQDITNERELTQRMAHQASHDALTGLVNRAEFDRRLARVIDAARRDATHHALCYLDLDQFKVVNDTCGHLAGDELLRQVAALLQSATRARDTVSRLGGDEFGILLEHCAVERALRVAENVRAAVLKHRFAWEGKTFRIGVSIGLVPITDATLSATEALRASDSACYVAKEEGRNRIHIYRNDDAELTRWQGDIGWVSRLNTALERGQFALYAQRIEAINGQRSTSHHIEILVRMVEASGATVPPSAFLPAAERYSLSTRLDQWVVEAVIDWFTAHPLHLEQLNLCSINLSALSIGNEDFLNFVVEMCQRTHFPAKRLCFEITETAAIANLGRATRFIDTLRTLGCKFSLDDFGSGMSSFTYLRNMAVDYVKIDGAFIRNIESNPVDCALVRSINEIAQALGKQTIAEFVETEGILRKLKRIGVQHAQGYHVGKPHPLGDYFTAERASRNHAPQST